MRKKKQLIFIIAVAATTLLLTDSRFQFFVLALQYETTMADSTLKDTTVTNIFDKKLTAMDEKRLCFPLFLV